MLRLLDMVQAVQHNASILSVHLSIYAQHVGAAGHTFVQLGTSCGDHLVLVGQPDANILSATGSTASLSHSACPIVGLSTSALPSETE